MKHKLLPLKALIPLIEECFKEDKDAIIVIKGTSMRPFYINGQTKVKLTKPETLKKRDAVLFINNSGYYVLHRIERFKNNKAVICGDGNKIKDIIPKEKIIARVKAHSKNDHWVDERNTFFRFKVKLWQTFKPFRRILMRFKRFNHKD